MKKNQILTPHRKETPAIKFKLGDCLMSQYPSLNAFPAKDWTPNLRLWA